MEECKSPEAEALVAAAVRGPYVAASDARVEAEAYAAVAAVQAGVDARRAEALAAVQAGSEGRRAAAASVAATSAPATAAPSLFSPSPAGSNAAGVTSAEVLLCQGQVSGEFARIDGDVIRLKSTMDRLLASVETLQDAVACGASRVENVEAMLQQFMGNVGDRQPAPRDSGDVRERQLRKSQINDDTALLKNMASRKHWVLRGRIPPNIGDSAADIQSFVGEAVNVTTSAATQIRGISDFDVHAYGPRADGIVDHLLMVADRLDFLRQALVAVLSVGFSLDSDGDRHCREKVATIDAAFTSTSADLRRHTLSNITLLPGPAARAVMSEMVNDHLCLRVNDLMRFPQKVRPPMVPAPSEFTFSMPPVPSFKRTSAFCSGGVDVLKLVELLHVPRDSQDGPSKRKSNPASPGTPKKKSLFSADSLLPWADADSPTANSCIRLPRPTPLHPMPFATVAGGRRRLLGRGRWRCPQSPSVGPEVVVAARVLNEDTGPSCRLSQHLGGRLLSVPSVERRRCRGPAGERGTGRPLKA